MSLKLIPPGKRGRFWYLRGSDKEGRFEYSTGQTTRGRAEAWVQDWLARRASRRVPGAGETVAFARAAEFYKAAKHPSKADAKLVDKVAEWFGEKDCREITHADLVAAAHALKPRGKDTTKNRKVMKPAAAVLHYASEQKWCEYQRIKTFRESRISNREPASDGTMRLLLANAEAPPRRHKNGRKRDYNVHHKEILLVMLYETGLRISDLLTVQWEKIDLQKGRVEVRISKTDQKASLPLSDAIVAMLANLPVQHGRLFPWSNRSGVYKWLKPLRERLGVAYTPHMSRHALATAAGEAMIPDKKAAELGAWSDPRSLHRYQHVRPDAIPGRSAGSLLKRGKPA